MERYECNEMICPVCEAVIDHVVADWIVILDGDCPSSCDDGALVRVRCPKCGFPIFGKTVDADYVTHHHHRWPEWVEVVWNDEGDPNARALVEVYGENRPSLWFAHLDGEFVLSFGKPVDGVWHTTNIRLVPADDIKEQSQRARRAVESLDAARAWLEANPPVDVVYGVDELMERYAQVARNLGLGDWRPGDGSK